MDVENKLLYRIIAAFALALMFFPKSWNNQKRALKQEIGIQGGDAQKERVVWIKDQQ